MFRDGVVVGAGAVSDFDHGRIVHLLAGEELLAEETESRRQKAVRAAGRQHEIVFEVDELRAGALAGRVVQGGARRDRRDRRFGRLRA